MKLFPLLLALSAPMAVIAQEPDAKPAIKEVSPGILEIGGVRLDQKARSVTFPAVINMEKGILEYLLVGRTGPTHESLLITDVRPLDVHTAMVLLGAKTPAPANAAATPPAQLTPDYLKGAPKLEGNPVLLLANWKDKKGAEKQGEVSDWLLFAPAKGAPPRGPWTYTGSMFGSEGKFLAQIEDIFVSLVTNPPALINNPRKGNDSDLVWDVNEKTVPPAETVIEFTIQMVPPTAAK